MKYFIALLIALSILSISGCGNKQDYGSSGAFDMDDNSQVGISSNITSSALETSMIENKALISFGLKEVLTDDVMVCVKTYVNYPPDADLSAETIETFKHEDSLTYLYIVPRCSGSYITIEGMAFEESRNKFVTTGILFESVCMDDYALLVQADLPEAGPRLCVTITYKDITTSYTPAYDGRGDTVYPYVKNGVLLDEAPFSEASDKTQTDDMPEYEIYKEQLREMLIRSEIDFPDYMQYPFFEPDKILIEQVEKGHISGQQENLCFLFELRWGEGYGPAPAVIGVESKGELVCVSFSHGYCSGSLLGNRVLNLSDIDGDGLDEIVANIDTGGNGGAGVYESAIYKWENSELHTIYFSGSTEHEIDMGFELTINDGYQCTIRNIYTGSEEIFAYDGRMPFGEMNAYDNNGKLRADIKKDNPYKNGDFKNNYMSFKPVDIDGDGVCEILTEEYFSAFHRIMGFGMGYTALKYHSDTDKFEVVKSAFRPFEDNTSSNWEAFADSWYKE